MYVLFEDSGNFKAEKVFSEAETTLHVESDTGRRRKIKASSVLFKFDKPGPAELLNRRNPWPISSTSISYGNVPRRKI